MDAKIITLPLEKVKLRPLADGLVNLQEAKEAYKLRGQSYETGKAMGIVGDSYKISVSQEKIIDSSNIYTLPIEAQTTEHNHPKVKVNRTGYNNTFSFADLNGHLFRTKIKAIVSTRDCLFFFNDKNKKNLFQFLMEKTPVQRIIDTINNSRTGVGKNQIKGLLKNKNNIIEYDNNTNRFIQEMKKKEKYIAYSIITKRYQKSEIEKMSLHELSKIINNEKIKVQNAIDNCEPNPFDDFMHSELERISKKANWVYKRYTWEELFPNVIRSRGKK